MKLDRKALGGVGALIAGASIIGGVTTYNALTGSGGGYPNDPRYSEQWPLQQMKIPDAWRFEGTGGTSIAFVGTGIGYPSPAPDLAPHVLLAKDFSGSGQAYDNVGNYGLTTGQAGIVGAVIDNDLDTAGIVKNVFMLNAKVCNFANTCTDANTAAGIDWSVDNGAKIIVVMPTFAVGADPLTLAAIGRALDAGKLVFLNPESGSGPIIDPAASAPDASIVVGGTKEDGSLSNHRRGVALDLVAPSDNVLVPISGGCCLRRSLIMFGEAHAAGVAGLLSARGFGASTIRRALLVSAVDVGGDGPDPNAGFGIVDAKCAMASGADVSGSRSTDTLDVVLILNHFGMAGDTLWNIDGAGDVDASDAVLALGMFGAAC